MAHKNSARILLELFRKSTSLTVYTDIAQLDNSEQLLNILIDKAGSITHTQLEQIAFATDYAALSSDALTIVTGNHSII